jgi:hypothetical protein
VLRTCIGQSGIISESANRSLAEVEARIRICSEPHFQKGYTFHPTPEIGMDCKL